jgi:hypothetical protein
MLRKKERRRELTHRTEFPRSKNAVERKCSEVAAGCSTLERVNAGGKVLTRAVGEQQRHVCFGDMIVDAGRSWSGKLVQS